jgi:hypothetical protein
LPTAASAVALSSATNSFGVSVGAPGSLIVMKSTRRPSGARNATINPRKSASVSACGQPRPFDMRPMPMRGVFPVGAKMPRPASSGGSVSFTFSSTLPAPSCG